MVDLIPYDKIEYAPGRLVCQLATPEQCDEAIVHLTREIAAIEAQLSEFDEETSDGAETVPEDTNWQRKARSAIKVKNAILGVVRSKRKDLAIMRAAYVRGGEDDVDV